VLQQLDDLRAGGSAAELRKRFQDGQVCFGMPIVLEALPPQNANSGDALHLCQKSIQERRLADSCLAGDEGDLTLATQGTLAPPAQRRQFGVATRDAGCRACGFGQSQLPSRRCDGTGCWPCGRLREAGYEAIPPSVRRGDVCGRGCIIVQRLT
jgi:hypothetical protein